MKSLKILSCIVMFLLIGLTTSQLCAQGDIQISSGLLGGDINAFNISDFDLSRTGTAQPIFFIQLQNLTDEPIEIYAKGMFHSDNYGELAMGETVDFTLDQQLYITNQDLTSATSIFRFKTYDWNQDLATDLMNDILATSQLPADVYTLTITIHSAENDSLLADTDIVLDITNPSIVDLISPGDQAGAGQELPTIFTTLPQFQWESDIDYFRLVVAELMPSAGEEIDPESVLHDQVRLDTYVYVVQGTEDVPTNVDPSTAIAFSNSFQYPASAELPLEFGRTYFWRVTGIVRSSRGEDYIPSEIWGFTVADLTGGGRTAEQEEILTHLRTILGDDVVDELLSSPEALAGFDPTGILIGSDGQQITLDDLRELANEFTTGVYEEIGHTVE